MDKRRVAGAVTGALVAGVGLSAMMWAGEKLTGRPSELIELERKTAARLRRRRVPGQAAGRGSDPDPARPAGGEPATASEQFVTHGGHLALSALAGLAYAAVVDEQHDSVESGAAFGLAFFIAAYGLTGPLLGVTPLPWRESWLRGVQHPVVHTAFGICTALFARKAGSQGALVP